MNNLPLRGPRVPILLTHLFCHYWPYWHSWGLKGANSANRAIMPVTPKVALLTGRGTLRRIRARLFSVHSLCLFDLIANYYPSNDDDKMEMQGSTTIRGSDQLINYQMDGHTCANTISCKLPIYQGKFAHLEGEHDEN